MDGNLSKSDLTLFKKTFLRIAGIFMILISLFLIISLKTLNLSETGWNTLSSEPSTNFFGVFGSIASGFLLKEFGLLSVGFIIIILFLYGIKYLKYQTIINPILKSSLILFLIFLTGIVSKPTINLEIISSFNQLGVFVFIIPLLFLPFPVMITIFFKLFL